MTFLRRWMKNTALATALPHGGGAIDPHSNPSGDAIAIVDIEAGGVDSSLRKFERLMYYGRPAAEVSVQQTLQPGTSAGAVAAPSWPPAWTAGAAAAAASLVTGEATADMVCGARSTSSALISSDHRRASQEWLAQRECPFEVRVEQPPEYIMWAPGFKPLKCDMAVCLCRVVV